MVRSVGRRLALLALAVGVWTSCAGDQRAATPTTVAGAPAPSRARPPAVLVLTKTAGFRHASIEPAAAALQAGLERAGFEVVVDPDAALVTTPGLARFTSIVMLSTTGDWLDDAQQRALETWAAAGGAVAGIHAATDAEPAWPFLETLFGTRFVGHADLQPATVVIEDPAHPANAGLPARRTVTDEWYAFVPNPRARVRVLATVDETTYAGGVMGADHPIEWSTERTSTVGRVWYTALGHPEAVWADPVFVAHIVAGVAWTTGG